MLRMTADQFEAATSYTPEQDDLERVNCDHVGEPGHRDCGLCDHGQPRFLCRECFAIPYGQRK